MGLHVVVVDRGRGHHRGDFVGELGMVGAIEQRAERGSAGWSDAGAAESRGAADARDADAGSASLSFA